MVQNRQWFYRGSIKSCNYNCSYCPFSKKGNSFAKLEQDKERFFRFIKRLEEMENMGGAVQIVPYGEALIHPYYWEGLARLSRNSRIEAVGAQSNLSFPVEEMLAVYKQQGGEISKLRLWGTFHPEMTTVEAFIEQCNVLSKWQVTFCIGVVGVPEQIPYIRKLREVLDSSVYLWVNKMDGLGRSYTESEIEDFTAIDEYFALELKHYIADIRLCKDNIFVEADGTMRSCNLSRENIGSIYEEIPENINPVCSRKECSCYLAYSNRREEELLFFQPYPAFRIPVYPKAVFFDVDGTLVEKGRQRISEEDSRKIMALAKHCAIYLVTSLPLENALQKIKSITEVVKGGVFANGGRCTIFHREEGTYHKEYDTIVPMETAWLEHAVNVKKKYGFRIHVYQRGEQIYKVTLSFPENKLQRMDSVDVFVRGLTAELKIPDTCKWILEENCIQITASGRGKLEGILELLGVLGYKTDEVMVVGNSDNDIPMLEYFPHSVAVKDSSAGAKKAAGIQL